MKTGLYWVKIIVKKNIFLTGNGGQWMYYYNNMKFSTYDSDNDNTGGNSALSYGPFWHGAGSRYPYSPNHPYKFVQRYSKGHDQPQIKAVYSMLGKSGKYKYIVHVEMKMRRK